MTGNSMDAVDLVLTDFDGDIMTDICTFTRPYTKDMQKRVEDLRGKVFAKTAAQIADIPEFKSVHDDYVRQIAECINEMCKCHNIDKTTIDAIGFHGKTLDHNPPSKAKIDGTLPYTLQIGSGQMLADLTGIPVVYDFRSDPLMSGFDGAPLVPPHNAHISASEGDGIYYNGGNTSNFAIITDQTAQIGTDAGPFNEYTDNYIRQFSSESYDKDGIFGKNGKLSAKLLQKIFEYGRPFYETPLPKSGDPAYYHKEEIFKYVQDEGIKFADAVRTFEYAAAYMAVQALTLIPDSIKIPNKIILFGGGWKNPIVRRDFADLLSQKGFILPEHQDSFAQLQMRLVGEPDIRLSGFGDYMEARLFADLARYKLENKAWEIPEIINAGKKIICGRIATPKKERKKYNDCINRAAKGWQKSVVQDEVAEIRFCLPTGKWGFLSPYAAFPIKMEVDGNFYTFPSVEHYYQAMKFHATDKRFAVIASLKNPDEARLMTKLPEYKINRRKDFAKNKFAVMEQGMRAKFMQNPDAAKMLKATGDAILIKSCAKCYKCGFGEGSGQNRLGKILMKIRKELPD